jgi:hypothetical protein
MTTPVTGWLQRRRIFFINEQKSIKNEHCCTILSK